MCIRDRFQKYYRDTLETADALIRALRQGVEPRKIRALVNATGFRCDTCHAAYRDLD